MTIVLFLVDTSASMNQRTYLGTSLLDIAKGAVETFIKQRGRDPATRGLDRYMLLTFEDPPKNIKAGWKESQAEFGNQLKNLKAEGFTKFGAALGNALHYLNLNRLSSGMDFYGMGRYPFHLEPALILTITDGASLVSLSGVENELKVPVITVPGSELTKEPFRWDQRIFSLVLRIPGHHPDPAAVNSTVLPDNSPVDAMCDVTGGRSYCITSHKVLLQCIDSLVQKVQKGAVCCFEKFGPDPPLVGLEGMRNFCFAPNIFEDHTQVGVARFLDTNSNVTKLENGYVFDGSKTKNHKIDGIIASRFVDSETPIIPDSDKIPEWHRTKRMIFVPRMSLRGYVGHWPIPESYWPDLNSSQLPPRAAHPEIKFKCEPCEPIVFNEFPFDKYELEPSPLTQFILERRQPTVCWQVFIQNSGRHEGPGHPFGYLKAATNLGCVNLFIMPYNYPVLIPLLHELKEMQRKPDTIWRTKFDKYLKSIPLYYYKPLRKALERLKMSGVMSSDIGDHSFSYSVGRNIQQVNFRAKEEMEVLAATVKQQQSIAPVGSEGFTVEPRTSISLTSRAELEPLLKNATKEVVNALKRDLNEFNDFKIFLHPPSGEKTTSLANQRCVSMFQNPFDIPRNQLIKQITKMRVNLKQQLSLKKTAVLPGGLPGTNLRLQEAEDLHNLMIGQMGNFDMYKQIQDKQKLRPLEEPTKRGHAFGNPYKVDKKMLVDEIGEFDSVNASMVGGKAVFRRNLGENAGRGGKPPKRTAGPLSRSFRFRRKKRTRLDSTGSIIYVSDDETGSEISDTESVASLLDISDTEMGEEKRLEISIKEESGENVESTAGPSQVPNEPELEEKSVKRQLSSDEVYKLSKEVNRLIRIPGKEWKKIDSLISEDIDEKQQQFLLKRSLIEARRFKRNRLEELIEQRISCLIMNGYNLSSPKQQKDLDNS